MPKDIAVVGLWIMSAVLSIGLTTRWFWRFRSSEAFASVLCTTIAGGPGVALLAESMGRYVERATTGASLQAFRLPTTLISCLWFIVGPILLFSGLLHRVRVRNAPHGTTLVQLTHVVMWGWSTFIGFLFAASI